MTTTHSPGRTAVVPRLLGLQGRPGKLALLVFQVPLPLYKKGWGWIFGHAFLLLVHQGRNSGTRHETALKILTYDAEASEAIVFAAWGEKTDWVRNIRVHPALAVRIGRETFTPEQRFLTLDESFRIVADYRRSHPWKLRLLRWLMGWDDLRSNTAVTEFVRTRPLVAFRLMRSDWSAMPRG